MNWHGERLLHLPESGSVPEVHFDGGVSGAGWSWFLFDPGSSGQTWVGCFRGGDMVRYTAAHVVPTTHDAVVVANGFAYWVSLEHRTVRYTHDFVTHAVPVPDRPLVLGATFTELFVLAADGVKWCDSRVAMDGITISEVTSRTVTGCAPTYSGDVPFELDLDTMRLTGGVCGPQIG